MANAANFNARTNARQATELVCKGEHIAISDLKYREKMFKFLSKNIPDYPTPVVFHITEVAHVTNKTSLLQIMRSEGFKGLDNESFSWWSLKINEAEIRAAEERFLQSLFPDRTEEETAAQQPFLSEFTTSPAFNETSRYGNFRFMFPLSELMEAYKKQICESEEPVLRVYETKLFKQEIEYVVLVHSPQFNEKFSKYPLLTSRAPELPSSPLVDYDGNQIIWRAQAICETHKCQLVINGKQASFQTVEKKKQEFYVWDQVSLVFHASGVLTFPKGKLKASLSCCKLDPNVNLSKGENFFDLDEAEKFLESLPDEKEEDKSGEIKMEVE